MASKTPDSNDVTLGRPNPLNKNGASTSINVAQLLNAAADQNSDKLQGAIHSGLSEQE